MFLLSYIILTIILISCNINVVLNEKLRQRRPCLSFKYHLIKRKYIKKLWQNISTNC